MTSKGKAYVTKPNNKQCFRSRQPPMEGWKKTSNIKNGVSQQPLVRSSPTFRLNPIRPRGEGLKEPPHEHNRLFFANLSKKWDVY